MYRSFSLLSLAACILGFFCISCNSSNPTKRILIFSKSAGYHHASIDDGNAAIVKLGNEHGMEVDTTTNAAMFNEDSLKNYSAVVFLHTTGDMLDNYQEAAFERYIQAGGGYMGIHAAADAGYDWRWYGRLVGAYFLDHPGMKDTFPNIQEAVLHITDSTQLATKGLPASWKRTDEYYSFKSISKDIHVIMTVDEATYNGGHNGAEHPIAWYHEYDGGRAFYTALGHTKESFSDPLYLQHILGGIEYAIGDNRKLDYDKATTQIPPDADRFTKTQLVTGAFYEPTEMTILPNLDILVIQRRGEIMLYKHDTKTVKQAGFFDVYFKATVPGVNAEEGMLGLAKDPDFEKNNYVYIYYSPADSAVNRLSRFVFKNDTLDKKTEKVVLEVKSQREICCHTGGSIAFGPDKLLYFSSGDNSTPFNERDAAYVNSGYAPLNDVPGHMQYDARRSAGNTNDLRGKIMRLMIKDDGSYEIPEGNLFPKGTPGTRPEIYVMGDRNPYRIAVDQKNSFLYWGEVGPDANNDSFDTRGPRGYDEINQARKAGNFGWPYFVGNNYPYREFNYATGETGPAFDPQHPVNNSRNNTGLKDLPIANPAFIWYPYSASPDFPQVGTGGRNAMAGPVYYTDMFPKETRLPEYFNNKLIIYDWIRGWIKLVTMTKEGDFDKMEPVFSNVKVNSLIDMEVGPDGKIYLLEYGSGWFTKNPDAGLAVIDYNAGNRPPHISELTIDKTSGVLPLTIKAAIEARDPENDKITYLWDFGNGKTMETTVPTVEYSYTKPGDFNVSVTARDEKGAEAKSNSASLYAGNQTPEVSIKLMGNKSFYFIGIPVKYEVMVTDKPDTSIIDPANLYVSADYISGFDKAQSNMGHQEGQAAIQGKNLMLTLDCKSCHKEADASVGPSYLAVSKKYMDDKDAITKLSGKILKGGSGVWGEVAMPGHPNLPTADATQIVSWIMSLSKKDNLKPSLPKAGAVQPQPTRPMDAMVLSASYTDHGANGIKALTGNSSVALRSNIMALNGRTQNNGFRPFALNGTRLMGFPNSTGSFALPESDLSGIASLSLTGMWPAGPGKFTIELHLDSASGALLGQAVSSSAGAGKITIPLKNVSGTELHTIYVVYKADAKIEGGLTGVAFNASGK